MIKGISLTASMRSNLMSLSNISTQMDKIQNILSTGKKVNSAIDNASSYYQARSLTNRASDLNSLLDSMSQGIQTVQAATKGLESATAYLEQLMSIVEQADVIIPDDKIIYDNATEITANMTTDEIQTVLSQGGTVVLTDDIIIDKTLILDNDVELIANGKTITYDGSTQGDSALNITANAKISGLNISYSNSAAQGSAITIKGGKAEIDNLTIDATGQRVYGVQVLNKGELLLDNTKGITTNGEYSHKVVNGYYELWDGEYNTDMIIDQIGGHAPAADYCKEYVPEGVSETDENFGQGTWYLPATGELLDLYGTDYEAMANGESYAVGDIREKVDESLNTLKTDYGVDANKLNDVYSYCSSNDAASTVRTLYGGRLSGNYKKYALTFRPFQYLENVFDPNNGKNIEIGDVVYSDMSYGKADEYDANKTVVGVVGWVSDDRSSAKIIALTDARKIWATEDVNPDTGIKYCETAINNTAGSEAKLAAVGSIVVTNQKIDPVYVIDAQDYMDQYKECVSAYDELIKDASYQGVNLLTGGELKVTFNETRTHELNVKGQDIRSDKIGLTTINWENKSDIETAINEITSAIAKLRNLATDLGNKYTIIQTRQNFTEALSDILEVGADKLTLADMNETSAEYLMLQTRQQLAVNSLSLASQSASSILKLF